MPRAKKTVPAPSPASAAPGAALLAVDLQASLLGALPAPAARAVRARAGLALAAARVLGIPVFFTEQVPAKLGPTDPALARLAPGVPVFPKNTFSALADDTLLDVLRAAQIEHLLLIGLETPVCVYQSALGALAEGFQVTILSDAVAARRPDDHAACLAALRHAGVTVLPSETVFYALLHDAAHPQFKAFTQLVKSHA
jgi:nicotinamidase-related amidase